MDGYPISPWRSSLVPFGEVPATWNREMDPSDSSTLDRISDLVGEERELRSRHRGTALDESEVRRLEEIEVELDQCWDLLNQRRALRDFDLNPDQAVVRDQKTVEGYQ